MFMFEQLLMVGYSSWLETWVVDLTRFIVDHSYSYWLFNDHLCFSQLKPILVDRKRTKCLLEQHFYTFECFWFGKGAQKYYLTSVQVL